MRFAHDTLPQRVVLRSGEAARSVADEVERLGGQRVMLIAGEGEALLADRIATGLDPALRWGEVRQHVPLGLARRAREAARAAGIDVVVPVGGGSTVGLAKAVAMEVDVQIVAVPTTYAGSEATNVWGLTDGGVKTTGVDPAVLPATVVYDAELTRSLPLDLTVASGLNGLAHCVDSLWAPRADPINLAMALEGVRALSEGLRAVAVDGGDLAGREQCLYGAYLSAVAFASAGSGMHHKICHVLGGAYDLPHAPTHAVVLPYVLAHNVTGVPQLAGRLAGALGSGGTVPGGGAGEAAVTALDQLREELEAPRDLAAVGLPRDAVDDAVARCLPVIPESNPVPVTERSLRSLLHAAWSGDTPTPHPEGEPTA